MIFLVETDKATFKIETENENCKVSIIDNSDGTSQVFTLNAMQCTQAATAFIEASELINLAQS